MPYLGGVGAYREHCDGVAANGYEGFADDGGGGGGGGGGEGGGGGGGGEGEGGGGGIRV